MLPATFCIDALLSTNASIFGVTFAVACAPRELTKPPVPTGVSADDWLIALACNDALPACRICAPSARNARVALSTVASELRMPEPTRPPLPPPALACARLVADALAVMFPVAVVREADPNETSVLPL